MALWRLHRFHVKLATGTRGVALARPHACAGRLVNGRQGHSPTRRRYT
ncbi:hypothetical protein L810_2971 [Burkholderia sp. AU4i]|nr:hypothetical protein L810_2971 [Burkholderia sp. AU4i]